MLLQWTFNPFSIFYKQQFKPSLPLRELIEFYQVVNYNPEVKQSVIFSDFPRTAMDFVFCFDGKMQINIKGEKSIQIHEASYLGNFDTPYDIEFSPQISILHVRFKAQGIYPLTKIPLSEFLNNQLNLNELINPTTNELYQQMGNVDHWPQRIQLLENFLLKIYENSTTNYRLNQGLDFIQQNKGIVSVKDLSTELNTNYKSLERWFKTKVGLSPKKFTSITRFKNILEDLDHTIEPDWMSLAMKYGFHDHSHFIKSFEEYAGLSPKIYFDQLVSV